MMLNLTRVRSGLAIAILAGGGSLAGAGAANASPAALPKCTAADLGAWIAFDRGSGAAGSIFYPLYFTNLGGRTCTMHGFPGVSAVDPAGHQLGDAATRNHTSAPHLVVLLPGATAHTTLQWSDAAVFTSGCKPVTAYELKIYPPDQRSATHAVFDLAACSKPGHPYLSVEPITSGV
jgi:hypothetical protein